MSIGTYIAGAVVVLIGLLVIGFTTWLWVGHLLLTRRTIRLMRERGRILTKTEFEQHADQGNGTVIFENPTLGWRVLHVWWTPEDVLADTQAAGMADEQFSEETGTSPAFDWCHDVYLDREKGRALLVPLYLISFSYDYSTTFQLRFPDVKTTFVNSAMVHLAREIRDRNKDR